MSCERHVGRGEKSWLPERLEDFGGLRSIVLVIRVEAINVSPTFLTENRVTSREIYYACMTFHILIFCAAAFN
jgi:hypothetical protein